MSSTDGANEHADTLLPDCDGERCVHALSPRASCRACVEACPKGAWLLTDDGLGLDTEACDGCGLCLPACPEEALSLPISVAIRAVSGGDHAYGACDRAGVGAAEGVMPCLHALGLRDLARLHARSVRQLVVAEAPCEGCARATGSRLEHAVGEFHRLALDHEHEPLVLRHVSPQDWQRGLAANDLPGGLPHVGRRGLLKSVLEAFSGQAGTRPAARRGDEPSRRLALFVPDIDGTRCTGCEACVRICPHGALKMEGYSSVGWSYRIIAANCTGCRLCVDICDEDAVTLERMTRQQRAAVHLVARRCTRCGAPFAEPEERGSHDSVCRICRRVDHSRKLFQVLE